MKKWSKTINFSKTIALLAITGFMFFMPIQVSAVGSLESGVIAARGEGQPATLMGDTGVVSFITNIMLFAAGALAVIMLVWGGIRYTISNGNAASVTAAKNTILYALLGLVIAFLAFAIVNWVLATLAGGFDAGSTR